MFTYGVVEEAIETIAGDYSRSQDENASSKISLPLLDTLYSSNLRN